MALDVISVSPVSRFRFMKRTLRWSTAGMGRSRAAQQSFRRLFQVRFKMKQGETGFLRRVPHLLRITLLRSVLLNPACARISPGGLHFVLRGSTPRPRRGLKGSPIPKAGTA